MDFFENIILKKQFLGNQNLLYDKNSKHIAFGIDANFTIGTGVLIYSILQHNKGSIVFHIFTDNIYDEDINRFESLTKDYKNIIIVIYYVNANKFSKLSTSFIWSSAIYYRFLVSNLINNITNKILYLDSDILCINSFEDLFRSNFKDNVVMAVSDYPEMMVYAKKQYDFSGDFYFNTGVLMINLDKWKSNNIPIRAIDYSLKNEFKYYDQDVLNILLANESIMLDKKYNVIYHLADMKNTVDSDTVFLHYSGSVKPWQAWGQYHFLTLLWLKYKNNSPWKDVPIFQPKTYKQAKFMARTLKRNKKYISSVYWYLKYSLWKIKPKYM